MSDNLAGWDHVRDFLLEAAEDETREPRPDWRSAVHDALLNLDRIVCRNAHPDDVMHARLAAHSLAGIWLSVEEAESQFIGDAS